MKKFVLFSMVLVLAIVVLSGISAQDTFKRQGAGAMPDFPGAIYPVADNLEMLQHFYNPKIDEMKPVVWVETRADRKAGWVFRYELNNKNLYLSIKEGLTESRMLKLAFNVTFKEKWVSCFCYFENGVFTPEGQSEDMLDYRVYCWLAEKGLFDNLSIIQILPIPEYKYYQTLTKPKTTKGRTLSRMVLPCGLFLFPGVLKLRGFMIE